MRRKSARRRPPRRPPPGSRDVDANASSKVLDVVVVDAEEEDARDESSAPAPRAPFRPRPGFVRPRPPLEPLSPRAPSAVSGTETILRPTRRASSRVDALPAFADDPPTTPDDGTNGAAVTVNPDDSRAGDASPSIDIDDDDGIAGASACDEGRLASDSPTPLNASTRPHATRFARRVPVDWIEKNSLGVETRSVADVWGRIARRRSRIQHFRWINN